MHLLVGLGNPGEKYISTRHNIGFLALDHVAGRHGLSFSESKWQALVVKTVLWGQPILLAKPQTFMNLSGRSVAAMAAFFKILPQEIMIVHDDLDLALGRVKIVMDRGAGGHNGIRSIIAELGTRDFVRIRAGIGRPETSSQVTQHVLSEFRPDEIPALDSELQLIEEAVRLMVEEGITRAMNCVNSL